MSKSKHILFIFFGCCLLISVSSIAQVPDYVPLSNLRAWWALNGNANDLSGSNINGSIIGASSTINKLGATDNAYSFNGTTNWINMGDNPLLDPGTNDISISAWINTTSTTAARIYSKGTHGGMQPGVDLMIYPGAGGKVAAIYCPGTVGPTPYEKIVYSNAPVNDGQWHMLTMVVTRNSTIKLYVDGVLQSDQKNVSATSTVNIGAGTYNASLGVSYSYLGTPNDPHEFFNGKIDEVGVWMQSLTNCEINELYRGGNFTRTTKVNNSVTAQTSGAAYQWLDCNNAYSIIPGANSQTYIANNSGSFAVSISKNGCIDTSACILVYNKKINSYDYWLDNDYGNVIINNISAAKQFDLNATINLVGIDKGFHVLHCRFYDDHHQSSSTIDQFFQKNDPAVFAQANIIKYEYWFDNNYSARIVQNTVPGQNLQVLNTVQTNSLIDGMHTFHIRFMDDRTNWSSTLSEFFQKLPLSTIPGNKITVYEYWFDNNYSASVIQQVGPATSLNLITGIQTSSLTDGMHAYHLRFKDSLGKWSSVLSSLFQKISSDTIANNVLTGYEYWFDNDYANRVSQSISHNQQLVLLNTVSASSLPEGMHVVHFRFKDTLNVFSGAVSKYFMKTPVQINNNLVCAYKYWFDQLDSNAVQINFQVGVDPLLLNTFISLVSIPKGVHLVHFQFKDTLQQWSSVVTDTITKLSLPVASFTADNTIFCDSGLVSFANQSIDGDLVHWNFGDGTTDTIFNGSHNYLVPGTYTAALTVTDSITGQDSTSSISVTINSSYHINQNAQVCFGDSFFIGSAYQTVSGIYIDSLFALSGCDSIFITSLVVNELPQVTYIETQDSVCLTANAFNLSQGLPVGGSYNGTGVSTNMFDPSIAGIGTWQIIYSYIDSNACSNIDIASIFVDPCIGIEELEGNVIPDVYPNPNIGDLFVRTNGHLINKVVITDVLEKKILELQDIEYNQSIDLRKQNEGIYYVTLYYEKEQVTYKIIVFNLN